MEDPISDPSRSSTEITRILKAIGANELVSGEQLLPLVYDELRRLAASKLSREAPGQTLQATALVHEAYCRIANDGDRMHWNSRAHFFGAAAEAMRRILVEQARRKSRIRHGGDFRQQELPEIACPSLEDMDRILDIDMALSELAEKDLDAAEVVKLHVFAGMTLDEVADAMQISRATVYRNWAYARATLKVLLRKNDSVV